MADTQENQAAEPEQEQTDWEAKYKAMQQHSREWEKLAKANKGAAEELEKLKAAQMSEQEREKARADAAEAELEKFKAEAARIDMAKAVAEETGVPFEFLEFCADEEAMRDFAQKFSTQFTPTAPRAVGRIIKGDEKPRTNADVFAEFLKDRLH